MVVGHEFVAQKLLAILTPQQIIESHKRRTGETDESAQTGARDRITSDRQPDRLEGAFNVDDGPVEGGESGVQASFTLPAVRAYRNFDSHGAHRGRRRRRRLESGLENSVRPRLRRQLRSIGLFNLSSDVRDDLYGDYSTRIQETLLVVAERKDSVVQIQTVVGIALLAVCRKVIILDLNETDAWRIFSLSAAVLALGAVYWLTKGRARANRETD